MQNTNKLLAMEGVRGVASFIVLLSHLQLIFFMNIDDIFLNYSLKFFPQAIATLLNYIFQSFHDGNFSVWLFWVMSGFVLSLGYFKKLTPETQKIYILKSTIKRYFRLLIPVLFSVLFAYILLLNNMMTNQELSRILKNNWFSTFYTFDASFFNAIKSSIYNSFFNFDRLSSYNRVLWTMEAELYGSLFIFALLSIVGYSKIRYLLYPIIIVILYTLQLHWLNAFMLGIVLCDLYVNTKTYLFLTHYIQNKILTLIIFLLFLILIGMPNYYKVFHLVLASILILFIISSPLLNNLFSSKILVFLGRISFSLYLIHIPILCSLSGLFYIFFEKFTSHTITLILTSILTIIVSLLFAILLHKLGDKTGINLGNKIALWAEDIYRKEQKTIT